MSGLEKKIDDGGQEPIPGETKDDILNTGTNLPEDDADFYAQFVDDTLDVDPVDDANTGDGDDGGNQKPVAGNADGEQVPPPNTPSAPEKAEVPGQQAPASPAQQPVAGNEPAVQPGQQQQQPAEPQAAAPQPTPTDLNAAYQTFMSKGVEVLADQVYALDEQTAEQLDTQPSKVLPQLAARMHMQIMMAALTQAANIIPKLVQMDTASQAAAESNEVKFFEKFPALKEHKDTVGRLAAAYRQAQPNATLEQAIDEIGTMAMVHLRLPLQQAAPPNAAPAVPVTTVPPTPTHVQGGLGATPAQPAAKTAWDELISEE